MPAKLARIRHRLLVAGCEADFRRRAWRCPSCRRRAALHLLELPDGSIHLRCAARTSGAPGCSRGRVLETLGLNPFDVGPDAFGERVPA